MPRETEKIGSITRAIRAEDLTADVVALSLSRLLVALKCCHAAGRHGHHAMRIGSARSRDSACAMLI